MNLTVGQLIDQLIIENLKIWHAIDNIGSDKEPADMTRAELEKIATASLTAHQRNAIRSKLVADIDSALSDALKSGRLDVFQSFKTYE